MSATLVRLRGRVWLMLLAVVFISSCGEKRPWVGPKNIRFTTPDGFRLMATMWKPRRGESPAVLMIANLEQDRGVFRSLAEKLAESGIAAVGLDLRIQGGSYRANELADPLRPENIRHLTDDVRFVLREIGAMRGVDSGRLALLACDASAEIAVRGAWADSSLQAVALLSPVISDSVFQLLKSTLRPIFVASSFDDQAAAQTAKDLAEKARSPDSRSKFLFAAGRGSDMLWSPDGAELIDALVEWFRHVLLGMD